MLCKEDDDAQASGKLVPSWHLYIHMLPCLILNLSEASPPSHAIEGQPSSFKQLCCGTLVCSLGEGYMSAGPVEDVSPWLELQCVLSKNRWCDLTILASSQCAVR